PVLAALDPHVTLADTMPLVPLGLAAAYFPFTVGGAGTREGAFVALLAAVGVAHADAMATSLLSFGASAIVAALGGVLQVVAPLSLAEGLGSPPSPRASALSAVIVVACALHWPVWESATRIEVFALGAFALTFTAMLFASALQHPSPRLLFFAGLALGLTA